MQGQPLAPVPLRAVLGGLTASCPCISCPLLSFPAFFVLLLILNQSLSLFLHLLSCQCHLRVVIYPCWCHPSQPLIQLDEKVTLKLREKKLFQFTFVSKRGFLDRNLITGQKGSRRRGFCYCLFILQTRRPRHPERKGLDSCPTRPRPGPGSDKGPLLRPYHFFTRNTGGQREVCFLHSESLKGTWQSQHKHKK